MLWFTVFFLVILKIPIVYLAYVIWWAVKDPPQPGVGPAGEGIDGIEGGPGWSRRPRPGAPGRRRGPHGSPARRPLGPAIARRAKVGP